mmetsp:Transcript_10723/g.40299  ORF Transcript_10723/g.40299 Transcript_10723/m.40299 type:complete len:206 (-) Transcript_10723:73-690(-)
MKPSAAGLLCNRAHPRDQILRVSLHEVVLGEGGRVHLRLVDVVAAVEGQDAGQRGLIESPGGREELHPVPLVRQVAGGNHNARIVRLVIQKAAREHRRRGRETHAHRTDAALLEALTQRGREGVAGLARILPDRHSQRVGSRAALRTQPPAKAPADAQRGSGRKRLRADVAAALQVGQRRLGRHLGGLHGHWQHSALPGCSPASH